jgi:hypothetical protein
MQTLSLPKFFFVIISLFFLSTNILNAQVSETEPNNTPAQANTLPLNGYGTGIINPAGDVDWWKVKTNADGLLSVTLTPLSGRNTYVYLYDTAGVVQFTGTYSTTAFTISQDGLAAGTYYMEVVCYYSTDTSSYIISNNLTKPLQSNDPEPNNNRSQADVLQLNDSTQGHIGYYYNDQRDTTDWYKVTTNADGLLRLSLNPVNGQNVYITLYDNDGVTVLASNYSSTPFSISYDGLAAGTYYVAVYCYYSNGFAPYVLYDSLFKPTQPNDIEPNNTASQALTLPLDDSAVGHIGYYYNHYRDTTDWYKVTTNADGVLRLSLNPVNGSNVYITLYDHDGITVLNSAYAATPFSVSTDGLAAGTYYVAVYCYYSSQFTPYVLSDSLFSTGVGNDIEPNNTPAEADILPLDVSTTGHIGYYYNHQRDTTDWYKVTTTADGLLRLSLSGLNGSNVYVTLYDHNGTTILNSQYSTTSFSTYTDGLAAGTYYVAVYCYYNSQFSTYILSDSLFSYNPNQDPQPNNYFSEAPTIPANRTVTGHDNFYYNNASDTFNTWKINYTGTNGNLNLTFNLLPHLIDGSLDNIYFNVYSDTTAAPIFSNYFIDPSNAINLTGLAQGYYYIKLYPYFGGQFEAYSITDSFTQVNIAQISLLDSGTQNSCGEDSLVYTLSTSHSPYTVRLYRNGALYDSLITATTTAKFTGLNDGNYYATVYGDGATDSAYSKTAAIQFLPPYPIGLTTTNISIHTATLNWTKYDCVKRYTLQYRAIGSNTWLIENTALDTSMFALSGLTPYTNYSWRVASVDSVNDIVLTSAYSDSATFRTLADTAHIVFISAGLSSSCDGDTLKFFALHSEAPYTIQLYKNGVAYLSGVSVTDTATFTGLSSGNYYATATGTGSGGSFGTSDTTQLTPPLPSGLSAPDSTISATSAVLHWDSLSCVKSFNIQYELKGTSTWITINTTSNTDTFNLTGLLSDTVYFWRVASVDSVSIPSAYSDTSSFRTLSALPVTLLYFNANAVGNTVQLNWKTTAEINNKYFEVQRSADGITFTAIGNVPGNGTSGLPHTYELTDGDPLQGINYYRLKQVDNDGNYVYTNIVSITFGTSTQFVLYPNPATSIVNIKVPFSSQTGTVIIYDMQGRFVFEQFINGNIISEQLDISKLSSGIYNVTLLQGNQKQNQKLIKE